MTKSIFEYKDEQDWYLASFGNYNHLTCFGGDEAYEPVSYTHLTLPTTSRG